MQRMTTDTPQTNMETLMNFAYAKDKEVHLTYGDGMEDVTLADYIVDHAKSDFDCAVNREDVINGDSCWECDCPLAVLNAVATQSAELRAKLKKYEDAEESGLLVRLLCKAGDTVYALWPVPTSAKYVIYIAEVKEIRIADRNNSGLISFILEPVAFRGRRHEFFESDFGKLVFFSSAEAEAALKGAKADG